MNKVQCVCCGIPVTPENMSTLMAEPDNEYPWCLRCELKFTESLLRQAAESYEHHRDLAERLEWDLQLGMAMLKKEHNDDSL